MPVCMKQNNMKFSLAIMMFFWACSVLAEKTSGYWELGAGISFVQSPHYAGSSQSKNYVVPFPHIVIETEYLSVDRNVMHGHVLSTDVFRFDISFSGAFKVDSDEDELRQGMPDLDYIIEAGPSLKWLLSGNFDGKRYVTFEVPVRGAIATDFDEAKSIGWHAIPTLHWHNEWHSNSVWKLDNRLRVFYESQEYNDYIYSVDFPYATAERPYYQAEKGYGGWEYMLGIRHEKGNRAMGFVLNYTNISQAVFNDSPLVAEDHNFTIGFYASWVLAKGRFLQ